MNYESNIKNFVIKNCIKLLSDEEKYEYILDMIDHYTLLIIHKDFPIKNLLETFVPFLPVYLFSKYSLNPNKKLTSKKIINSLLKIYKDENCLYGRKIYKKNIFDHTNYYFVTNIH